MTQSLRHKANTTQAKTSVSITTFCTGLKKPRTQAGTLVAALEIVPSHRPEPFFHTI
jgi:hypothetical protein